MSQQYVEVTTVLSHFPQEESMKPITTILSVIVHLFLVPVRLGWAIVKFSVGAVKAIALAIVIVLGIIAIGCKRLFTEGDQNTANRIYAYSGKPLCEICKEPKKKNRFVTFSSADKRWTHNDCFVSEKVATYINQERLKKAADIPFLTAKASVKVLEICLQVVKDGNPNAINDGGVGGLLANAAMDGAILNVRVNLSRLIDKTYTEAMESDLERLKQRGGELKHQILAVVKEKMAIS